MGALRPGQRPAPAREPARRHHHRLRRDDDGAAQLGTPPRLYNQVVRAVADDQGNTPEQNARLFAFVNVDERKRSERELRATLSELQLIFDSALVAVREVTMERAAGRDAIVIETRVIEDNIAEFCDTDAKGRYRLVDPSRD